MIATFLAFDWGKLRIGVASGNTLTRTAQSVTTLTQQGAARDDAIQTLVREWRPVALVCGVPYHPDGAPHKNTKLAQQFAAELRTLTGLTVFDVDERYSTTEAKSTHATLKMPASAQAAKRLEAKLDGLSACIILEQYMRSLPE
jgi:putative holliday junction resolvase